MTLDARRLGLAISGTVRGGSASSATLTRWVRTEKRAARGREGAGHDESFPRAGPERLADALRTQIWPLPALAVVVALAVGWLLPRYETTLRERLPAGVTAYLFSGGQDAARTVLSAIATSLVTVTSLTFSLTVVTLQLASTQYSPRVLRTFARDRFVHVALAVLLGTFTYALTVLRSVSDALSTQRSFVPQLSVTLGYLLALASVLVLVVFLAHLAQKVRVETILRDVHSEAMTTIRHVGKASPARDPDEDAPAPPDDASPLCARSSGVLVGFDDTPLLEAAVGADAVILLDVVVGDSLVEGTPVGRAWRRGDGRSAPALDPDALDDLESALARGLQTGFERTSAQDLAFGLRQVVDVAVKALSPGINDPTTAVQALSHASALVRELAVLDLGPHMRRDDDDEIRVVVPRPGFDALLALAVTQPRRYGAAEPAVLGRLLMLLREVAWASERPDHQAAVAAQLDLVCGTATEQHFDESQRRRLDDLAASARAALQGRWVAARP